MVWRGDVHLLRKFMETEIRMLTPDAGNPAACPTRTGATLR